MMGWTKLLLLAAAGGLAAWRAFQRPGILPEPLADLATGVKCGLETEAIRRSAGFLRSRGAVQSALQAEQEALVAHRVACALAERLGAGSRGITVMVLGRVIHLEGQVRSSDDRIEAERVAREVSRAKVIADDLQVASREP